MGHGEMQRREASKGETREDAATFPRNRINHALQIRDHLLHGVRAGFAGNLRSPVAAVIPKRHPVARRHQGLDLGAPVGMSGGIGA